MLRQQEGKTPNTRWKDQQRESGKFGRTGDRPKVALNFRVDFEWLANYKVRHGDNWKADLKSAIESLGDNPPMPEGAFKRKSERGRVDGRFAIEKKPAKPTLSFRVSADWQDEYKKKYGDNWRSQLVYDVENLV